MKRITGKELLTKLKDGTISTEERILLEAWYDDYIGTAQPFDDVTAFVNDMKKLDDAFPFVHHSAAAKPVFYRLNSFRVGAAAAIVLIVIGLYLFNIRQSSQIKQISHNEVLPGSNGATLTLGNGKKINLSTLQSGNLDIEGGIHIVKNKEGQLTYSIKETQLGHNETHTLSTERGQTYALILPDKSKVWLNAGSSLTYHTSSVQQGQRKVILQGEAYFEVAKDSRHPFIVASDRQQIEVLGTAFNIKAYPDEPSAETTLLEGAIKLSTRNGASTFTKVLTPNQQATVKQGKIHIREILGSDAIAWKDGFFLFDSESLESVMNKISRWYNVQVVYDNPNLKNETMLGTISKHERLSTVLDIIERTGIAKFEVKQRTVYVKKK